MTEKIENLSVSLCNNEYIFVFISVNNILRLFFLKLSIILKFVIVQKTMHSLKLLFSINEKREKILKTIFYICAR